LIREKALWAVNIEKAKEIYKMVWTQNVENGIEIAYFISNED